MASLFTLHVCAEKNRLFAAHPGTLALADHESPDVVNLDLDSELMVLAADHLGLGLDALAVTERHLKIDVHQMATPGIRALVGIQEHTELLNTLNEAKDR